jgi:hypothetical protein
VVMVFPVTVENAVETGVGTHVVILSLGHLLPSPRILKPTNTWEGDRRSTGTKKWRDRRNKRDYGAPLDGLERSKIGRETAVVEGKERILESC